MKAKLWSRQSWRVRLDREIRASKRTSIIGAGNVSRGDDAVGLAVVDFVSSRLADTPVTGRAVQILKTFEVPENYTGDIRRFGPDLVLIFDAAIGEGRPGDIFVVEASRIVSDDVSTHKIPLSAFVRYVETEMACRVLIVGIHPSSLDLGMPLSGLVRRAGRKVGAAVFHAILGAPGERG